ncbi:MAG: flagellar filament capping protein FliD [Steroidobacteraceae bacterium]
MPGLQSSGIGSGLDVNGLVSQLVAAERAPVEQRIARAKNGVDTKLSAFATLRGAVAVLSTATQALSAVSDANVASSEDPDVVVASASTTAVAATHSVEVKRIASAHKLRSSPFGDGAQTVLGAGRLTLTQNGRSFSVELDAQGDLGALRAAINAARDNTGVRAALLNTSTGVRLVLEASSVGSAGEIALRVDHANGALVDLPASMQSVSAATDADVWIDGCAVNAVGNRIRDAIEGVTVDVLTAKPDTPLRIEVKSDVAVKQARLGQFIDAYNNLAATLQRLRAYNPDTREGGPLIGDATLRNLEGALRRVVATPFKADALQSAAGLLGLEMRVDGSLRARSAASGTADPARWPTAVRSERGIATLVEGVLRDFIASDGAFAQRTDALQARKRALVTQAAALDTRMSAVEQRYRAQFTALDSMLSNMQTTSSYLAKQLK